MNKRTSILLSTTMASIATAACAFCMAQSANAADVSTSTSTSSVNAFTVSSVAGVTSEKVSKDDSSTTQNLKSEGSSSANGGGSVFARGSTNEVKTAEPKDTEESAKSSELKKTAEPAPSSEQSSPANSAQVSNPQQSANSEKDTKNSKSNGEVTGKSEYFASTGHLTSDSHAESSTNQTVLKAASVSSSTTATDSVFDTEKNYTKTGEGETYISYSYVKNPKKITNPFSDVISDDEITKAFSNGETEIEKIYFKPDATPDNPNPKEELSELYTLNYKQLGILKNINGEYIVYKVYKNNYKEGIKRTLTLIPGVSINGTIAKDGSIYAGSEATTKGAAEPFNVELNGYKIADDSKRMINLEISSFTNHLYMKLTYKYKFNIELLRISHSYCQSACYTPSIRYYSVADAQFHFVDDLQYRAKNPRGVDDKGKLKERGNSDTHPSLTDDEKNKGTLISSVPFHEIEGLQDIGGTTVVTTDKAGFYRNDEGDGKTSILSFDNDPDINYAKRPTLAELIDKNIPGYVYWDNDIDKPNNVKHEFTKDDATTKNPGNHYLSFAYEMKDGKPVKFLSRKHYYVTFRPIPTQLVVQYKGLDQQVIKSQNYAIYADASTVNSSLRSSDSIPKAPERTSLVKMVENKDTSLLSAGAGYLSNGFAYLAPGTYNVHPTADAPENYEWVADSKDIANSSTSANVNIEVNKSDTDSTQKVVTFVLRRKIAVVKFINDDENNPYATVKVQQGLSISGDSLTDQSMPPDPTKPGFTFNGWFTGKDGKGTKFTGNTTVSSSISVYSSYTSKPSTPPTPAGDKPNPVPKPKPIPKPEPEAEPVPELPVPVAPAPILTPAEPEFEPESAPALSQPEQPEAKRVVKSLPQTGSTATSVLASAIASLFAGFVVLAESFAATRKLRD